jgi:uncharacterized protein (TIGR00369 family)
MTTLHQPLLDALDLHAFLEREFPQVAGDFEILSVGPMRLELQLRPSDRHLRPGGTVSGPAMFSLADCAVYLAIISHVGPEALAVTTNASIDFMRKPASNQSLTADVKLLKLGRSLAVGDVSIRSAGADEIVARATLTYSRPPAKA